MKTMLLVLVLVVFTLSAAETPKPKTPQERKAQSDLRVQFSRKNSKLSESDAAAIKKILDKYPDAVRRTNAPPAAAKAPAKAPAKAAKPAKK